MPRVVDRIAFALSVIGALNWGLVGLFKFDLVATLAGKEHGKVNGLSRTVYSLVGLAGLSLLAARVTRDAIMDQ